MDFRSPAFLERDLAVEAWCERIDGRKAHLRGRMLDGDVLLAEAQAIFIEVDLSHFERGGRALPAAWKRWGAVEGEGGAP